MQVRIAGSVQGQQLGVLAPEGVGLHSAEMKYSSKPQDFISYLL